MAGRPTSTKARPLRILIVDDHPVLRAGLVAVLSGAGFNVCGEAGDGDAAVARFDELLPDVALMDLQMPGLDGPAAIAKIRAAHPDARIIVLTTFDTEGDVTRALRGGARGYILKDAGPEELIAAIRHVWAGGRWVAPSIGARLAERGNEVQITIRELTVLRLVAEGNSNKQIAQQLAVAEGTVKVHLKHLFRKLGVSSRTEASALAVRRGLVRLR